MEDYDEIVRSIEGEISPDIGNIVGAMLKKIKKINFSINQ